MLVVLRPHPTRLLASGKLSSSLEGVRCRRAACGASYGGAGRYRFGGAARLYNCKWKKGNNELRLAVSLLGGGWGFIAG